MFTRSKSPCSDLQRLYPLRFPLVYWPNRFQQQNMFRKSSNPTLLGFSFSPPVRDHAW